MKGSSTAKLPAISRGEQMPHRGRWSGVLTRMVRRVVGLGLSGGTSWKSGTQIAGWVASGAAMPAPQAVKEQVLARSCLPGAPWVETGTFKGDTTAFLARLGPRVVTLEPMPELAAAASERFRGDASVTVLAEPSEVGISRAIEMSGDGDVNFWLDGHFSGGVTFRGSGDTPIRHELGAISAIVAAGRRAAVMIDDVRLFVRKHREISSDLDRPGYPGLDALVGWARGLGLAWWIEHDIFIARCALTRARGD